MPDKDRWRDRKFRLLLYPEDVTHQEAMDKLMADGANFAAIVHDKDVWTDTDEQENPEHKAGEVKKKHWHVVLKYRNAVWNTAIAKELGIQPNYIRPCDALDSALLYLVHYELNEKAQYDFEQVFGPLKTRLATLLADTDESTRALTIYDLIRNSPGVVTYTEIFEKACKGGMYGDFRRMGSGVVYLIKEHNAEFYEMTQSNAGVTVSRDAFNEFLKWTGSRTDDIEPL